MNCGNCNQTIDQFEVYIEYDDAFYHEKCYCCNYCYCSFSYDDKQTNEKTLKIPIKNKNNKLCCINDLIRTLNCSICRLNFEPASQIYKLKKSTNDDRLAHVDCVKCNSCKNKINVSDEYIIEETSIDTIHLKCKYCLTGKKSDFTKVKNKNRLSSRQKELLKSKFIQLGSFENEVLTEESLSVSELSKEIGCTKKSIIDFINKRKDRLTETTNQTIDIEPKLNKFIEELRNIDRELAPNKSPFTQNIHKSLLKV